jgi:hypothetical protein
MLLKTLRSYGLWDKLDMNGQKLPVMLINSVAKKIRASQYKNVNSNL